MSNFRNLPATYSQTTNKLSNDLVRINASSPFEQVRRFIHVTSRSDPNGNANQFTCLFGSGSLIDELYLDQCFIPNNFYNCYDPIILEELGNPPVTFTLPDGIYRCFDDPSSNFQPALVTALNTASPTGSLYTVVYDPTTQKLTITNTSGVTFRFNDVNPITNITYRSMGWNATNQTVVQAFALSQTSTGSINMLAGISNGIRIRIEELPVVCQTSEFKNVFTFLLQDISLGGDFITGKCDYPYKCIGSNSYSKFSIQILDDTGRLLRVRDQTTVLFSFSSRILA